MPHGVSSIRKSDRLAHRNGCVSMAAGTIKQACFCRDWALCVIGLPPLGNRPHFRPSLVWKTAGGGAMLGWTQRRRKYQQKRNSFLLLTLSGAIRSADVELPYCRNTMMISPGSRKHSAANAKRRGEHSIWTMDLRQFFFKNAASVNVGGMK